MEGGGEGKKKKGIVVIAVFAMGHGLPVPLSGPSRRGEEKKKGKKKKKKKPALIVGLVSRKEGKGRKKKSSNVLHSADLDLDRWQFLEGKKRGGGGEGEGGAHVLCAPRNGAQEGKGKKKKKGEKGRIFFYT